MQGAQHTSKLRRRQQEASPSRSPPPGAGAWQVLREPSLTDILHNLCQIRLSDSQTVFFISRWQHLPDGFAPSKRQPVRLLYRREADGLPDVPKQQA